MNGTWDSGEAHTFTSVRVPGKEVSSWAPHIRLCRGNGARTYWEVVWRNIAGCLPEFMEYRDRRDGNFTQRMYGTPEAARDAAVLWVTRQVLLGHMHGVVT